MEIDIRTLLSKLNPECKRAMGQAAELCVKQTQYNVELEHLLFTLIDNRAPDLVQILQRFGIADSAVTAQLQRSMDGFKRGNGRTPALSPHFMPLFQEAWLLSSMLLGSQQVRSGTVLLAMLEVDSLRGMLIETAPALLNIPRAQFKQELPSLLAGSSEDGGGAGISQTGSASDLGAGAAQSGTQPGERGGLHAVSHGGPHGGSHAGVMPTQAPSGASPANRPSTSPDRSAVPIGCATRSQRCRTGSNPSPRQRVNQRANVSASSTRKLAASGAAPASAAMLVVGRSRCSGWCARLTPIPITIAPDAASSRIPASLAPDAIRSFGHLSWSRPAPA